MTTTLSPLGTLLLLRLSIAPEGAPAKAPAVRKDLASVLPELVSEESLSAAREELVSAGLASVFTPPPKPSRSKSKPPAAPKVDPAVIELTAAGRSEACARLNVDGLPAKLTWTKLQSAYLLPAAIGDAAGTSGAGTGGAAVAASAVKPPTAAKLVADLVAREAGVKPGTKSKAVLEALACRELGFPDARSWDDLRTQALNRMLSRVTGQPVNLAGKQLEAQVPLAVLHIRRPDDVKPKLLRQWLKKGTLLISPRKESVVSPLFAARAVAAARRVGPEGWFGDNKVYISHAQRRYNADHPAEPMSLADFKARLIEAHRASHLTLSRADLVAAMNATDVAESEARYMNAQFHFILMEGASE